MWGHHKGTTKKQQAHSGRIWEIAAKILVTFDLINIFEFCKKLIAGKESGITMTYQNCKSHSVVLFKKFDKICYILFFSIFKKAYVLFFFALLFFWLLLMQLFIIRKNNLRKFVLKILHFSSFEHLRGNSIFWVFELYLEYLEQF